jgi:exopolysaccharide biosynthesis polyprenyl glycosylphosphotransferase
MLLNRFKKIFLFVGDLAVLYSSLYLTLLIRFRAFPTLQTWNVHFRPFTILFVVWVLVFYIDGLYEIATSKNDVEFYNKILRNLLINYGLAAAYFYLLTNKLFSIKPQTVFFIFMGVVAVLFFLWRYWYNELVQSPTLSRNVLVIGMKDEARELIEEIIKKPQLGYRISAIIHDGYRKDYDFPNVKIFGSSVSLKKLLREEKISTVVTAFDPHANQALVQNLFESLALKLQFSDLPTFYEKLTGKIPVTTIGHIWFLENLAESEKDVYDSIKRGLDIIFAVLGLIISVPLIPFISLAIKLNGHGTLLFRQTRVGLLGKHFVATKFRSMIVGAEKEGEPQWAKKNDPRVTNVGKFLRKTRMDEIPQLFNVLRGEMSFIGPRPERPEFVKNLQSMIPFYNERHLVKPGLTGWAQINFQYGASTGDALKKLQYDLFYIKNRSLALDVGVMLKTINIILTGRGQ